MNFFVAERRPNLYGSSVTIQDKYHILCEFVTFFSIKILILHVKNVAPPHLIIIHDRIALESQIRGSSNTSVETGRRGGHCSGVSEEAEQNVLGTTIHGAARTQTGRRH